MSQAKLYTQLISSLEDPEFDKVAKQYLIEVDGMSNIINCNGPYDKGLDMRHPNVSQIEVQYQITTRENKFEEKLIEDLIKAKENVKNHKLPIRVKYFYSYPLTNNKILSYKKRAKDDFGLILDLIEAKTIAEIAGVYDSIGKMLYEIAEIDKYRSDSDYFDNPKVKSFYDLMSFGSSTDIKYNIIKSFVLYYLFKKEGSSTLEIFESVNEHFSAKFNQGYFEGILRRMSSERRIHHNNHDEIGLTENEKERITNLLNNYNDEEALLKKELTKVLEKYQLENLLDEIIVHLGELYESNYSINLGEFTRRNSSIKDLYTATKHFNEFLKEKLTEPKDSEILAKELFSIADNNEILARIAVGQVYSKVSEPDRLQDYITIHNNNKDIFLDTNFIIVALCVYYDPEISYDNYHFKVAKQFLDFAKNNHLNLVTLKSYAVETANIFKEALAIIPFSKLHVFDALGGSNNILYTYYQHLKDWDQLHEGTNSFEDFLREFKFETNPHNPDYHHYPQIEWLLNSLDIEIELPPKYDISKAKELIYQDLKNQAKTKSGFAINNDAIMLMRLGDSEVDINPIDPIFCTWDISIFRVRKLFLNEFPNCTKWLMYTPTRLMDHFSMMNLQVGKGTLTNEVLSILEVDFNFQEKTQTLLDSMLTIINPKNEVGLKYANKLAELRQQEIAQIDYRIENVPDSSTESNSVDVVFYKLFVNYAGKSEEGALDAFKEIFTRQEFFDEVFEVLTKEIKFLKSKGFVNDDLFAKMDLIIEKSTNQED
jgi:hypothetical protein